MAFSLFFASSYFSVITPQGGSQNVIFVGSGYLTQRELYRLGALTTLFFLVVFLPIGTGVAEAGRALTRESLQTGR